MAIKPAFVILYTFTLSLLACSEVGSISPALGTLEKDRIELVADSDEPIVSILVREGEGVKAGQVLIQQDSSRIEVAIEKLNAEAAAAKAMLDQAIAGPRLQEVERARARLMAAEANTRTLSLELDRAKRLLQESYSAKNQVDILQGNYDSAVATQAEHAASLDELMEGTRIEIIDQARSLYQAALAALLDLNISLARAKLVAPVNGIIESLPFEMGERPNRGESLVVLLADDSLYARVHVAETVRVNLKAGAEARIRLDGYDESFAGKVRWISADASFTPYFALSQNDRSRLSYVAEIEFTSAEALQLPVGIPAEVYFPPPSP